MLQTSPDYEGIAVAYGFVMCAHRLQPRKYTREPYLNHLTEVATALVKANAPAHVVQAAFLHDVLEDTDVTEEELRQWFHEDVVTLVLEVTDVSKPEDGNRKVRKEIDRQHLAKTSDWGASIKLADLISNTKSIAAHDPNFAKVYLAEKERVLPLLKHGHSYLFNLATETLEAANNELRSRIA